MSEINVKDTLYAVNDAADIDLEPAFEAVNDVEKDNVEEFGGTETMNTTNYNTEVKTPSQSFYNDPVPAEESTSTSSFVDVDRIDADSAYRRITFLKTELHNIKKFINSTNCANMNPILQDVYGDLERCFKNAITLETIAVENGSSDPMF